MHPVRHIAFTNELRFERPRGEVFEAFLETDKWFQISYGQERLKSVVNDRWVGGVIYEDWGEGTGKLYGRLPGGTRPPVTRLSARCSAAGSPSTTPTSSTPRATRRCCGTTSAPSARSRTRWPRASRGTRRSRASSPSFARGSSEAR